MTSKRKPGIRRRQLLGAGECVVGAAGLGALAMHTGNDEHDHEAKTNMATSRMPVIYVPHGGGPWPFVELGGFVAQEEIADLRGFFESLPATLPKPDALLVVSAHWEESVPTVMTAERPPILYDYYGFPDAAYSIEWPAPGSPALADRVTSLLASAGIATAKDPRRGFDHGTFVPMKLSWPRADVPTIQLSLKEGLDPAEHIAIGKALAPLRDEGILIVGSGMSFHNLGAFRKSSGRDVSIAFDGCIEKTATLDAETRDRELVVWERAPSARQAHPREEHLLPLMVIAGAAGADVGKNAWRGDFGRMRISAYQYG